LQGYIITERGKWVIAILILVVIIIPSVIFTVRFFTLRATINEPQNNLHEEQKTGDGISSSEPPEEIGSGSDSSPANGNYSSDASLPILTNLISYDLDAGIIIFTFTPGQITSLDDNTASKVGELVLSPLYREETKIAVEIPQLADNDISVLTTAINNTLTSFDVSLNDIIFFIYQPEQEMQEYIIKIFLN